MAAARPVAMPVPPGGQTHWRLVALVVAAGVLTALQIGKSAIGLPALRADLDLSLAQAGWVAGMFAVLGLVGGAAAGAVVDRVGDRRLLCLGVAALGVGSALGATAEDLRGMLFARVIEGASFLAIATAGPALLRRVSVTGDRALVFGLWSSFMPAGMAIALLFGPVAHAWRVFWLANALLAGVLAGVAWRWLPAASATPAPGSPLHVNAMLRELCTPVPVLLALAFVTYAFQYFALSSYLPTFLTESMALPLDAAGYWSAAVVAANVIGNLAAGGLLARGARAGWLIALASAVMALTGLGLFAPATPPVLGLVLCFVFSAVGGILPSTVIATAMQEATDPRMGPVVIGLAMQASSAGQLAGPVVLGAAVGAAGWGAAAVVVAVAGLMGAVIGAYLRMRLPRAHG